MTIFLLGLNEKLEQKYEPLRGLSGLCAVDLKKIQYNMKKMTASSSHTLKAPQVPVDIMG